MEILNNSDFIETIKTHEKHRKITGLVNNGWKVVTKHGKELFEYHGDMQFFGSMPLEYEDALTVQSCIERLSSKGEKQ